MIREKLIFTLPQPNDDLSCEDVDGALFISAHETATGLTMADNQRDAICTLVGNLKGFGTTNSTDIWTMLENSGAVLYPLCPSDDFSASAAGYSLDLISATSKGTYFNFLSTDILPSGVTASSSKYFDMGVAPSDFTTNNNAFGFYHNTLSGFNGTDFGVRNGAALERSFMNARNGSGNMFYYNNTNGAAVTRTSSLGGLYMSGRYDASNVFSVINSSLTTAASTVSTASTLNYFAHGLNNGGVIASPTGHKNMCLYFAGFEGFNDANIALDFYESIQTYQENIITGGREA